MKKTLFENRKGSILTFATLAALALLPSSQRNAIFSEPIIVTEVRDMTESIYVIERVEGGDTQPIDERWILVFKSGYPQQQCSVVKHTNGDKGRCWKVDAEGSLYNAFGKVSGSIEKTQTTATVRFFDGQILYFKRFEGSLQSALEHGARSPTHTFEELIKKDRPSIKHLTVDGKSYMGKEIVLHGYALLDKYYNYGYENAKDTHFSVRLNANSIGSIEWVHIYFRKDKFPSLIDQLDFVHSQAGNGKKVRIKAIMLRERFQDSSFGYSTLLEGLDLQLVE